MVPTLVRVVLVQQEYGIYTRSCSSALSGACSSCVLVWLVRELTTLWHHSSRACSSCSVAVKACSCVLGVLVETAVCGQRADALPSLVARSHPLVYLWCWYSSMVYIPAPACLLMVYLWCWYCSMIYIYILYIYTYTYQVYIYIYIYIYIHMLAPALSP